LKNNKVKNINHTASNAWDMSTNEHVDRLKNTHTIKCELCNGLGVYIAMYSPRICKTCNGHGYYTKYKNEVHTLKENVKWYDNYLRLIRKWRY
jgi:DnaJ-class molecular chaperone